MANLKKSAKECEASVGPSYLGRLNVAGQSFSKIQELMTIFVQYSWNFLNSLETKILFEDRRIRIIYHIYFNFDIEFFLLERCGKNMICRSTRYQLYFFDLNRSSSKTSYYSRIRIDYCRSYRLRMNAEQFQCSSAIISLNLGRRIWSLRLKD